MSEFLVPQIVNNPLATQETHIYSLSGEDPLEKEMGTHSSVLAWEISWTEEPCGLESTGLQRVRLDLVTKQQQESSRQLEIQT